MTGFSKEYKEESISIETLRYMEYKNNGNNSRIFKKEGKKDIIVDKDGIYWYDAEGNEKQQLNTNNDLLKLVLFITH